MLAAGGACLITMGEGADSDAVSDIPIATVAKSIKITAGGVEGGKEVVDSYHATYDENTHTLSFNEDVEIQCSSTYTDRCFIATTGSPAPNIVIEINANVILTAPNIDGAFVAINSSSDVSIYGSGSLTINFPEGKSGDCRGIVVNTSTNCATISGPELNIAFKGTATTVAFAISSSNVFICNSKVNIFCGENMTGQFSGVSKGTESATTIAISNSVIDIQVKGSVHGYLRGIFSQSVTIGDSKVNIDFSECTSKGSLCIGKVQGGCLITNSSIDIKMGGTTSNYSDTLGVEGSLHMIGSTLNITRDKSKPVALASWGTPRVIGGPYISIKDSSVILDIGCPNTDKMDVIVANEMEINSSTVEIKFDGGNADSTAIDIVSVSRITNSVLDLTSPDVKGILLESSNMFIVDSDVSIHSKDKAVYSTKTPKCAISTESVILGSNDGTEPVSPIEGSQENYNWLKIVNVFTISFDLDEGTGTAVEPKTGHFGDSIELPDCDAKKGDLVFIGWSDGRNLYKAGETYTIGVSTTLVATYGEPSAPVGPTFDDITPSPSSKVTVSEFTVSGTVKGAQTLTVSLNGGAAKAVSIDKDGKFSTKVNLSNGYNDITVKATTADGGVTEKHIGVTYDDGSSNKSNDTNYALFAALCIVVVLALVLMVTRPWQ